MSKAASENIDLMNRFYEHFSAGNAPEMAKLYATNASFRDEFFDLRSGEEIGAMWAMLCCGLKNSKCAGRKPLTIEVDHQTADENSGSLRWTATYTHPKSCQLVEKNKVTARFRFHNGLIVEHRDSFDLKHWCAMALPFPQRLLRFAAAGRWVLRKGAGKRLKGFMASKRGKDGCPVPD